MDQITVVLKTMGEIIPNEWSIISFVLWQRISNLFDYLKTKEGEKTKRLEVNSNQRVRILEINANTEIELTKEKNRHEEFKILNGNQYIKPKKNQAH